jgi:hypothetical protein
VRFLAASLLACIGFVACARPPVRAPDRPRTIDTRADRDADAAVVVHASSLDEIARDVYAAISDGRMADARRRLGDADDANDRCWDRAHVRALPDGGALVHGPHGVVVMNASGDIVSHEVVAGCLRFADSTLRIVTTDTAVRVVEREWVAELPRKEATAPEPERIFVSEAWALVVDLDGQTVALNRRSGAVVRAHHDYAAAPGDWLVAEDGGTITMRHADGRVVDVRGCRGKLLAAARTEPREPALHVTLDAESTDTRVCIVRDDGSTRVVVPLGSATCGLAQAMPCPFVLEGSTSRLLGFGSMRGEIAIVDAVVGRTLSVPLPPGARFDGLSPGGVWSCERDRLCISYARPPDDVGASSVRIVGGKLVADVIEKRAERPAPWCLHAGLPVPSALCE